MGNLCQGEQAYSQQQLDNYFKTAAAHDKKHEEPTGQPQAHQQQEQQPAVTTATSSPNPLSQPQPVTSVDTSPTNASADVADSRKDISEPSQAQAERLAALQHQMQNVIYQTALLYNDNVEISDAARRAITQAINKFYADVQKLFEAASALRASNYEHAGQHDRGEKPAILMIEDLIIAQGTLPTVPALVIEPAV